MKSLTEIQTGFQFSAAQGSTSLTTETELAVFNRIYRGLAAELPWPELRRRDTSLTSTAATAAYDMPSRASIVFLDLKLVEIQDGDDEDKYKVVPPAISELKLNIADQKPDLNVPDYYVLDNDDVDDQIRFAPSPKYTSKIIRLTGIVEPDPLIDGDDATVFRQRTADDALEHLVAADFYMQGGLFTLGQAQLAAAQQVLSRLFGKEAVPLELIRRITG